MLESSGEQRGQATLELKEVADLPFKLSVEFKYVLILGCTLLIAIKVL
jgi:hypothetical protein